MEEEVVWSVKENASLYDALNLDDRSNSQVWNANVETFLGIHYEALTSSFTLVEDVLRKLRLTDNDLPRMTLLKRVQAALGLSVDLFGQDYFVNMRSKHYPEVPHTAEPSKHHDMESKKNLSPSTAQVAMNVTYEEACALSYFREGEIMKGLKEMTGISYMPVIVNEVRAIIASEAMMYATDQTAMLRKQSHDPVSYLDLNALYTEMSEKIPSFVKIMDFVKHATPTGKRQKDVYTQERREAIVASILAKSMCTFNSRLDAYKAQVSALLLNNGTSGDFELDLLAETNDTYPYKEKRRFVLRNTDTSKDDLVLYKDKNGKCKMINLYDLVKYDPADGATDAAGTDAATDDCPIDAATSNQQPFLLLSKPSRIGSKKRKGIPMKKQHHLKARRVAAAGDVESDVGGIEIVEATLEVATAETEVVEEVVPEATEVLGSEEVEGQVEGTVESEVGGEVEIAPSSVVPNPMELAMAVLSGEIPSESEQIEATTSYTEKETETTDWNE